MSIDFEYKFNKKTEKYLILINSFVLAEADDISSAKASMSFAIKVCRAVDVLPAKAALELILSNEQSSPGGG